MDGKVWLVGAGPGDPGLITVRGRESLERADVVVYDSAIPRAFLELVRDGAEVIEAGAQPGLHEIGQEEINRLLIHKAREGGRVVRLKGGDPFVFGRGGEEAEALNDAGVAFEVVNGVTSAVAAPTYAGIPITYRDVATSFAVVSGHVDDGAEELNWPKLATAVDTLVLMRALRNLERVSALLQQHGRGPDTPVAVVGWGTHARQETVVGTLHDIARRVAEAGIEPPTVTIVGEVVRLRERLRWYEDRPLFGKRVLVTRLRQQGSQLRRLLEEEGAEVVELPTAEVVETAEPEMIDRMVSALADGQYGWVVFTSPDVVERFFRHLGEAGRDARAFGGTRIAAAGATTAAALARHGIRADVAPDEPGPAALVRAVTTAGMGRRRVLVPRAGSLALDLIAGLRKQGGEVEEVPLYVSAVPRQPNRESLARLRRGEIDAVTFASATSVTNFSNMLGELAPPPGTAIACISEVAAAAARDLGLTVHVVAREPTIQGLAAALRAYFQTGGGAG
jgi:uroporphyrinogen III methyltransferase/synthase